MRPDADEHFCTPLRLQLLSEFPRILLISHLLWFHSRGKAALKVPKIANAAIYPGASVIQGWKAGLVADIQIWSWKEVSRFLEKRSFCHMLPLLLFHGA